MKTPLLVALLVATVHADPDIAKIAASAKPGQEIEVEPGSFMTFYRMQASAPIKGGWHRATSTAGAFSVEVPVKFNEFQTRAPATDGVEMRGDAVGGTDDKATKWSATCIRRKDGLHGPNNAHFADKTEALGTPVRAWTRMTELGVRTCVMTVEATSAASLPPEADIKRFLTSLQSTGKPR